MNLGYSFQSLRQFLSKCPWSTNHSSSSANSARICRPCSAKRLASARFSFVYLPWVVRAALSRAKPASVLGPVLAPPWTRQRPTGCFAGAWHGLPFRVLAPHRWPGQSGPKRKLLPFWNLPLVTLKPTAAMGFYYTPFVLVVRGLGGLVRAP